MLQSRPESDSWAGLTRFTPARIALGRAGASWRTETLLAFRLAHAQARDAVCRPFNADFVEQRLQQLGYETARLATNAQTRTDFLKRPDLGRTLSEKSREFLKQNAAKWSGRRLAVIVSNGLSALAAETQAAPVLDKFLPLLARAGWTVCPIFVVPFARVKLQDEIGALLGVQYALTLLGERPGLGSPDSLGAYFTCRPGPDKTDADRNCVSNIRPQGLSPENAAQTLALYLFQSNEQGCSGIRLKQPVSPQSIVNSSIL